MGLQLTGTHTEDWQLTGTHTAGLKLTGTHMEDWQPTGTQQDAWQGLGTQQVGWQGLDTQQAGWQPEEQLVWHMVVCGWIRSRQKAVMSGDGLPGQPLYLDPGIPQHRSTPIFLVFLPQCCLLELNFLL